MSDMIFVSYSKKDRDFANKLADDLESAGFQVWIDRSIGGGEKWRETIESSLKESKEVIIVVSPNSMESDWVRHEGSLAYGWGKKLYPILIATVKSLPPWLEEYQWVSFVNVPYAIALNSLVAALTPPNPMQDLLDEQVNTYHQTGQLLGEEILRAVDKARDMLIISPDAEEFIQKSARLVDERRQKEMEQNRLLADAETKQHTTRKRSRNTILILVFSFIAAATAFILSLFPAATGWRRLNSIDAVLGSGNSSDGLIVAMNAGNPNIIYVSDHTPGGFYKSTFNEETCWSKLNQITAEQAVVTHITANENMIYIATSAGLFSSSDGGNVWNPLQLPILAQDQEVTAIAVNPSNPMQVFVGIKPPTLFVTENGGKDWVLVNIPKITDNQGISALAHNGSDLLLAAGQSIWLSRGGTTNWGIVYEEISPIFGLSMVGSKGRFFIARGGLGIGDADFNSKQLTVLADSPSVGFIYSISASNAARYISSEEGIWYWRLWHWTNTKNWLLTNLGKSIPCY